MTAAYLFAEPTARPLTPSGEIMPGARLTFYRSGTTTLATIYADAELTTPLGNPLEADASGRFVPIYLHPLTTYRVLLHDADDVLVYDVDPYAPPRDYPPGTVMFFHGTEQERDEAYPPELWQVLDGNNGTPDGRDRFLRLAGGSLDSGDTGGSASPTTSAAGAHDHGAVTDSTTLTTAQIPSHSHGGYHNTGFERGIAQSAPVGTQRSGVIIPGVTHNDAGSTDTVGNSAQADGLTTSTGGGQGHTHGISAAPDHTHTVDVSPPYVALWALMRKAV